MLRLFTGIFREKIIRKLLKRSVCRLKAVKNSRKCPVIQGDRDLPRKNSRKGAKKLQYREWRRSWEFPIYIIKGLLTPILVSQSRCDYFFFGFTILCPEYMQTRAEASMTIALYLWSFIWFIFITFLLWSKLEHNTLRALAGDCDSSLPKFRNEAYLL